MEQFSKEQLRNARMADLFLFLTEYHESDFLLEGNNIRLKDNRSLSIKEGYCGFYDFATGDKGNSVDFLVNYMGYDLDDAVFALCDEPKASISTSSHHPYLRNLRKQHSSYLQPHDHSSPLFPEPLQGQYKHLFAYLCKRGISTETIQMLIDEDLLYQEGIHNNIVFANRNRDWGELRGTYDKQGYSFHGVIRQCRGDGYWSFQTGDVPKKIYVCEAAIDAISLYEIHRKEEMDEPSIYVSIGGVMKQPAINRIKDEYSLENIVLSVDNDEAGEKCRERNPDLTYILPTHKDWNEDLINLYGESDDDSEKN